MESIGVVFSMLIAVLISGVIVRVIPWNIPLPLIQIALGIFISAVIDEGITLNPEVFFFLFLPPLLFIDGWRIPKDALQRDRLGIFQLAFGLVILTVFGLGYIIHWLIPSMPLAVSFALAAIVSPTDPVAVAGIARRLAVPHRIMSVLEGEALFNDASGLVAFQVAVLAVTTGTFSFYNASKSFIWVSAAGISLGIIVTWALSFFRTHFTKRYGEELGSEILLSLLIPFAAYVAAEHLEASGILAAVAAGLTMSQLELSGKASALTRMRRNAIWDTIQFTLNGIMFVLLGEQLPDIFTGAVQVVEQTGHHNPSWLIVYATVICIVLASLRFLWIYLGIYVARLIRKNPLPTNHKISFRDILILSFGGVRGTVTLAGVLTLPLFLPTKEVFPARDLAIFLAATVIIISLVTASISLPLLLKSVNKEQTTITPFEEQRVFAIQQSSQAANKKLNDRLQHILKTEPTIDAAFYSELMNRLLVEFEARFAIIDHINESTQQQNNIEKTMRLTIITSARQATYKLARDKKISDEVAREIVQRLDYDEIRFS